jgi:hypothetical protein
MADSPKKPRFGNPTRRVSRAGLGGGALLIALALYLLFRGFGPGGTGSSGSGTGPGESQPVLITTQADPSAQENSKKSLVSPDSTEGGLTDDEKKALSGNVLTVLIDERDYLVELPSDSESLFRPTSLPRIIELAELTKGDSNGIRVRILRRETARALSEQELLNELLRIGIRKDHVIMPGGFVP